MFYVFLILTYILSIPSCFYLIKWYNLFDSENPICDLETAWKLSTYPILNTVFVVTSLGIVVCAVFRGLWDYAKLLIEK